MRTNFKVNDLRSGDIDICLQNRQPTQQALQIKEVLNFAAKAEEIKLKEKQSWRWQYTISHPIIHHKKSKAAVFMKEEISWTS